MRARRARRAAGPSLRPGRDPRVTDATLDNGARVLVQPMREVRTVAVGVWFDAGSRDEPAERPGLAHFVEHLLFKGSHARDTRALAQAMDRLGGQFNAFTGKEHTCFHARVLARHFAEGLQLLAELVLRARLHPEDVARERQVILSELALIADDPGETADELFGRALWGDHPLGRPEAGTPESVARLDVDAARAFYAEHYVGRRAVIAVAGAVDPEEAVAAVAGAFRDLPPGTPRPPRAPAAPAARALRAARRSEQAHVLFGTRGPALGDPARYAAELWVSVLGGSPSSRLFQTVREEHGLCYDVGAVAVSYTDAGELAVFLSAAPARIRQAVALAVEEVRRLRAQGLGPEEWEVHREELLAALWMGLEGTEARMARLGQLAVAGLPLIAAEEVAAALEGVRPEDVQAAAEAFGDPGAWAAAYVGPRRGAPEPWRWEDAPEAAEAPTGLGR